MPPRPLSLSSWRVRQWTLLAAVSSYNLKDARESGKRLADTSYRTLSRGLTGFGATYLAARVGAVFVDPSFPAHYKIVTQVIGYQALAAIMIGLTLRRDNVAADAGAV